MYLHKENRCRESHDKRFPTNEFAIHHISIIMSSCWNENSRCETLVLCAFALCQEQMNVIRYEKPVHEALQNGFLLFFWFPSFLFSCIVWILNEYYSRNFILFVFRIRTRIRFDVRQTEWMSQNIFVMLFAKASILQKKNVCNWNLALKGQLDFRY